ncbi:OmpA family protein [Lysobacter sp. Hz 25]|uniref:DUF7507 domain-containing protein n=1 Tax=Lysobacter sp. Hz 25 TaxID=3383698 RepID=UPI0038D49C2C
MQRTIINTGFEQPPLNPAGGCLRFLADSVVPGWVTTEPVRSGLNTTDCQGVPIAGASATGRPLELWAGGFAGIPPRAGTTFVELNAFNAARLRQDVCLLNGETVDWNASHRGRSGTDVMEFKIGAIPIARMATANDGSSSSITPFLGTADTPIQAGNGWVDYGGVFSYTGATGTVDLGFEAISAAGGVTQGNFLDNIRVNLRPFVEFAQAAYTQNETSPLGNRPRLLVAGTVPAGGMTVTVTITGGTATLGLDYTTASGTTDVSVFIPEGVYDSSSFPLPITILDDGPGDPGETITFNIADTAGTGAPYNLASLQTCGGAPLANTTSTISEDPDPLPRIQLTKALSANRLSVNDQFVLRIIGTNGRQTTTTGTGSAVGNGTITVGPAAVGSVYTLSEVMSAGSSSPLSSYSPAISCTNATPNSATVLPSGSGSSFTLTVTQTDNISCVFTNEVTSAPAFIEVVKTVTSGQLYDSVGDIATYSYVVTNIGAVAVDTLTVTDNRIAAINCGGVTTLAPGASVTCSGSYTVTQADIDDVLVTNIATAQARSTTTGQFAIDTDDAVINRAFPALTADKRTTATNYTSVGQVIPYTYVITNTGNTVIDALTVTDNRIAVVNCPVTTLAVGASTTCMGNYAITQADIDAGTLTNVMTATGTPPAGTLGVITDSVTLTGPTATPALTLDKTAVSGNPYDGAGDVVNYQYLVTNTGNVSISALIVSDDRVATVTCPVTTLAPSASTTCTGSYTITQADLDAGAVTNLANATGTPARGTLTPATDNVTVTATATPALTLDKTAVSGNPYTAVGNVVNYEYLVTNTGNVTINGLTVGDNRIATVTCPVTTLAPGISTTCTGSYTITQADLDAGSVTNNATATGTPTQGTLTPATDTATVTATATPTLTLDKTAVSGNPYDGVGDVVSYQYEVTNTGNVTINALSVSDDRIATVTCPVTTLAPGISTTCSGSYTITQADLDAGSVTNNASATGTPTQGTLIPATDNATVTAAAAPMLTLDKSVVSGNPYDAVGDVASYQYVVTNTGNVTISALSVADDRIATVSCPLTTLAPGASTTCTGSYTITQADLDAGSVINNASATGTPASGVLTPATDSATVTSSATPALTLDKTAVAGDPYDAVGDVVSYEYLVTNPSNITINALTVTDDKIATVTCPVTTLTPGASTTCIGSYTITQADLDAGSVINNATASGTPASGVLVPGTDRESVNATQSPVLTLDKTAVSGDPFDAVGDVVNYEYLVTNTGNLTITGLSVTDDRIATVTCPVTTLAPGASTTCTGSYTITQADLDAGAVTNIATANADQSIVPPTDTETVAAVAAPALTLDKTAVSGAPFDAVGDAVNYQYLVTNTGNVTINALTVTDDRIATVTCAATALAPGANTTCSGTYFTTQADLDAGSVTNIATATGTPTQGTLTPATDTVTVNAIATPALTLDKTVVSGNPYAAVGDVVGYQYVVTNTGNVTISALTVTDDKIATVTCPLTTLAPQASTTCTGSYTITQADLDAGSVTNNASATGTPASGTLTPATDSATVTVLASVSYGKTVSTAGPVAVGDAITFTLSVTVAYAATTHAVTLVDTLGPGLDFVAVNSAGVFTCNDANPLVCTLPAGTAPGTYTVSYTATVNTSATGTVTNTVVGTSDPNDPRPPTCAGTCNTSTPVAPPAVSYSKTVDTAGPVGTGDVLTFILTATVSNSQTTGVVTLTDTLGPGLTFGEVTNAGIYTCNAANPLVCTLPAGTAPGTYALSYTATVNGQATGSVTNAVAGAGTDNPTCAGTCSTATPVAAPAIHVAKSSDPDADTEVQVGETITYTLAVTVSNSATIADVILVDTPDPGLTIGALPSGCVMSGATITCTLPAGSPVGVRTFVYSATVNDQAGATVGNAVTATSTGSGQLPPICDSCSTQHQVAASELRLVKIAAVREVRIGDLVRYTLTVENVGNGTLTNGSVVDTPPAGFTYVEGSLLVVDGDNQGSVEGQHPLRFTGLDIAAGQSATLTYLMRVGAGVRPGMHQNQAQAFSPTTGEPISNVATAQVELVADPLLDDSLIMGTVFDDRDGDGWQDRADLSGVQVQGGFAPSAYIANSTTVDRGAGPQPEPDASSPMLHGIDVGAISARQSDADPEDAHQVIVRQRLSALSFTNDFVLTSAEGVTVRMDAAGTTTVEKQAEAAKGLNAAAPTVERRVAQGEGGYVVDYIIGNAGVDERGIPGVRIASTEGLLIETDQFGRYHLAGMSGGPWERGRNFILKVDPSTLPSGAEFTTDNPLLRRITPGLPVRFDWGVKLPAGVIEGGTEQIEMALGEVFFAAGGAEVQPQHQPVLEKIATKVREYHGGEVVIDANGDTEGLAFDRANAVKAALTDLLDAESLKGVVISARGHVDDPESLVVGLDEGGTVLGTVLFDTDQSTIKPEFEPLLDKVAADLEQRGGGAVVIAGHTDVRGSYAHNAALGMRRAKAVYEAIAKRLSPGVRAKVRVETGNDPAAPVSTERKQGGQGS